MKQSTLSMLLVCLFHLILIAHVGAAEHSDVIDTEIHHQTIDNFGASDAWTMKYLGTWSQASRNKVADLLFSVDHGIGLSLWRFNIGGGTNTVSIRNPSHSAETFELDKGQYDWNRQAGEQWFARAARERGVPYLLGFVNSPPGRLTRNGLTNSDNDNTSTTNLKPGMEHEYADYLCDIVQHFDSETDPQKHLHFDYLSPVNEPQVSWMRDKQEGSRASNDDIKKVLLALHDELDRRKMETKIRALETTSVPDLWRANRDASTKWGATYGNYLQEFLSDPALAAAMDHTMCYHDYSSAGGPALERDHRKLATVMANYPQCKLWMSEICVMSPRRDLKMPMALAMAKMIHADLAISGVSAWHWWLAVSSVDYKDGLLYTDWKRPGDPESLYLSKAFWVMGNYSRFIRPGMVRVDLQGDQHSFDGILGSAYLDPKSHRLVLVYTNVSHDPQTVRWTFKGQQKPRQLTPHITSAESDLKAQPGISVDEPFELPPDSVVTFVSSD